MWAQRKIGYLLAQIRLHGASEELVNNVTQIIAVMVKVRYDDVDGPASWLR